MQTHGPLCSDVQECIERRLVRVRGVEVDVEVFTLSGVSNIDAAWIATLRLDSGTIFVSKSIRVQCSAMLYRCRSLRNRQKITRDAL